MYCFTIHHPTCCSSYRSTVFSGNLMSAQGRGRIFRMRRQWDACMKSFGITILYPNTSLARMIFAVTGGVLHLFTAIKWSDVTCHACTKYLWPGEYIITQWNWGDSCLVCLASCAHASDLAALMHLRCNILCEPCSYYGPASVRKWPQKQSQTPNFYSSLCFAWLHH